MDGARSLPEIFLSSLSSAARELLLVEADALERALEDQLASARSAWPGVTLSEEVFLPFVAGRVAPEQGLDGLRQLSWGDLYLVCGCLSGDRVAVASFQTQFFPMIERAAAAVDSSPAVLADVKQILFQKLFVGDGDQPAKIAHYQGRGDFGTWLRVISARQAVDLKRRRSKETLVTDGALPSLAAATDDPELRFFKEKYRSEFKGAFGEALLSLRSRERNLLRYHLLHRLSIDEIGALYHVHRATAARWLSAARELLVDRTRQCLARSLQVEAEELASIMALVQSEIEVSLSRLLGLPTTVEPTLSAGK